MLTLYLERLSRYQTDNTCVYSSTLFPLYSSKFLFSVLPLQCQVLFLMFVAQSLNQNLIKIPKVARTICRLVATSWCLLERKHKTLPLVKQSIGLLHFQEDKQ
uniref:Uncharacterized protein n=1 Tax=Arabidopsis thaliana TaxID=3702 RepID=Q0WMF6_ARATH|nr:hypothetical protein [Arabidopsis thaliana]